MSDAKIYVGGYPTDSELPIIGKISLLDYHTFLLYDGDGDLTTTADQIVLQGAPAGSPFTSNLTIYMSNADDLDGSPIKLDTNGDHVADISASTLNLIDVTGDFANPEDGWADLTAYAKTLGDYDGDLHAVDTGLGYGLLPDLHISMSLDGDLKDMVADLASKTVTELFDLEYGLRGVIENIMYQWSGSTGTPPAGWGLNTTAIDDVRRGDFLEKMMDEHLWGVGTGNVGYVYAAWKGAYNLIASHLLLQSGLIPLFVDRGGRNTQTPKGASVTAGVMRGISTIA